MEQIVNSFNIFCDTSRGSDVDTNSGDDIILNLNQVDIDATTGQIIRLTVIDFSMYKTFTNVNANNSRFVFRYTANNVNRVAHLDLPHKNHDKIRDIAQDFADTLRTRLLTESSVTNVDIVNLTPVSSAGIAGTSNNIISFSLSLNPGHLISNPVIQFYEKSPLDNQDSDIFDLLGGNRIFDNTDTTTSSITSVIQTDSLLITCLYPAQRHTEQYVYLRTSLPSKNIATASLNSGNITHQKNGVNHTNILGRFPIDTEVVSYKPSIDREYFIDVPQHHLNNLRLYITDHHGRKIPQFGQSQATLGNLSFNCTIRVDTIQKFNPNNASLGEKEPNNIPKRFEKPIIDTRGHKFI